MIKKLVKSIREYKKSTVLTSICMVLEVFMEITIPFLLKVGINTVIPGIISFSSSLSVIFEFSCGIDKLDNLLFIYINQNEPP